MHSVKFILIVIVLFSLLGISTLHLWSNPAFALMLVGVIGGIYRKFHPTKPIRRIRV